MASRIRQPALRAPAIKISAKKISVNGRAAIRRRAISLIELLVVIAVGAVFLTITAVALNRFLAMSRAGQTHLERHLALMKLADQFRDDVWNAAAMAEPPDQPGALSLTGADGGRIEYKFEEGAMRRVSFQGADMRGRESFKLPGVIAARWEHDGAEPPRRLTLRLDLVRGQTEPPPDGGGTPLRISATLGRDRRFEVAKGTAEEARP